MQREHLYPTKRWCPQRLGVTLRDALVGCAVRGTPGGLDRISAT